MDNKTNKITFINKFSLRTIIIVPIFLILLFGSVLSYLLIDKFVDRHSEKLVATNQLRIKNHIYDHLNDYFGIPELVNKWNVIYAKDNQLNLNSTEALGKTLLKQVTSNNSIDYAYFANEDGGIVSSGLYQNTKRISYTEDLKPGDFKVYEADDEGNILRYIKAIENFDPRERSWYTEAITEGEAYWTEIYTGAQEDVLGMSTSYPLIAEDGSKRGVFGTDILLDQLSEFIKTIDTTENGILCIVDEKGMVVASSTAENPFIEIEGSQYRLPVVKSENDVIRQGYLNISDDHDSSVNNTFEINRKINGKNYYYSFSNYSYNEKINWSLMIAIPREDLTSDIELLFYRFTVVFVSIAILMLIAYIVISKWILNPIITLNSKVNQMTNENLGVQISTHRNDELGQLTKSFNRMSLKLKDYLNKLDNKQLELENINSSLEEIVRERTKELELLSVTDSLTSIYNKRYLIENLSKNIELANRYNEMFSVVIIDIDHFKNVNDTYGHTEGDKILMELSKFLSVKVRDADVLGRYGGEEFMIIMSNTGLEEAYIATERYRKGISKMKLGNYNINITFSGGIAEYSHGETLIDIVNRADRNLYIAKDSGRNMIVK